MRCTGLAAATGVVLCGLLAPAALGHSSFLKSLPAPGARLAASPSQVRLSFTEGLNAKLSKVTLLALPSGKALPARATVSGDRLSLRLGQTLAKGAYRVRWHSVATDDGHALDGFFSFGVRTPAVGGASSVTQSPFARDGWLRLIARALMYASLLLFSGAVMLRAILGRGARSWLVPARLADDPEMAVESVARRERGLLRDLGFLAAGAAALSAGADAADAAAGLSIGRIHSYLFASQAGSARLAIVVLAVVASLLSRRRPRAAALTAVWSLGALALSGHAASAASPLLSVPVDWLHLVAAAVWLGGIALIVVTWGPALRAGTAVRRLAVAREVLPVFGRIALPAFALVVVTGGISAIIELGSVAALWQTDYGRVLMAKMALVGLVALASYVHALRLRPRMLRVAADAEPRLERRHWRLLRSEPILGVGIVAAVALLVSFPLPPRQLADDNQARAAVPACSPCALPAAEPDELAVAEQGGSDVVAAWLRRRAGRITGTVRIYGLNDKPARDAFSISEARQTSCGVGCKRFSTAAAPSELAVTVRQHGHTYVARLTTRWRRGDGQLARRLLNRAQTQMRALRTVREIERVSSVPGLFATTKYRLKAPHSFAYVTNGHVQSITIGASQWDRPNPALPWRRSRFGGGLPFSTRSWFTWTTYARSVYLLGMGNEGRHRVAIVGLMDPGTPAWWRLYIDQRSQRVLHSRLITNGHFMTQRFFAFDHALKLQAPRTARDGN